MMRPFLACFATCIALLSVASSVPADRIEAAGLSITLDEGANVTDIAVAGTQLSVTPAPLMALLEASGDAYASPDAIAGNVAGGLTATFADAKATARVAIRSADGALRFTCNLKGQQNLPAGGMLLRFSFPFDAIGWTWHDDMQTARPITQGNSFENVRPLRAYADLPEWEDEPALRMGYSNRNFCTVLTGPVGLCLAVPIDRPCIFRTAYDAAEKRLEIIYEFALSPDTRTPNEVDLAFDLYPCDPYWTFRSALARYYRIYPQLFTNYIPEPGQWMPFSRLSEIDNPNELYFGLQEGAPEPQYDDQIDVLSTIYFTHAGMGARIPDYDPEADLLPPYDVQIAAVEEAFRARTGQDGMYAQVGLYNSEGKLDVRKWAVYAHLIAQFNLDPELPYGDWTLKRAISLSDSIKQNKNADLDGFYYDGLSAGINYNPDHFKTAQAPCLWDPIAKKPFINNFFSSCEFARAAAELLRPRGQVTMMNGALGASFYVAPWLDVLGAETGLRIPRESLNYIRSTTHHKPFLTLLKGNYEKSIGYDEIELFHKRCLAYGVFPGFFDWPPSGLGPGGRYWAHPRYFERDRDIFRKYQPLCQALAMAGWEPVTFARSSDPSVFVERFGPTDDGIVWLTLLNEEARALNTTLTVDAKALGIRPDAVAAIDVCTGSRVPLQVRGGVLSTDIAIEADGVIALQIAAPEPAAKWRAQQALDTIERGTLMRAVDGDAPPKLVHWLPGGATYARHRDGDNTSIAFDADSGLQQCSQWAMLFQPDPAPITLRLRAAGVDLSGKAGQIGINCRIAWVTSSFTHYENVFFDLPTGTYDWQDFEFTIEPEQALRSIHVTPRRASGATGTLRLDDISLSDANREGYLVDSGFDSWYEPVPDGLTETIASGCESARSALLAAIAAADNIDGPTLRDALARVSSASQALRTAIAEAGAQNGCRRVLRDLETVDRHMGFVTLASYGVQPPAVHGPAMAAAGDTIQLAMSAPDTGDISTRAEITSDDLTIPPGQAHCAITIPADAEIGSRITLVGRLHLGPADRQVSVSTTHHITVVAPFEMSLANQGIDTDTGAGRLRATIRNNRTQPVVASLQVSAPRGWAVEAPAHIDLSAGDETNAELRVSPTDEAEAGSIDVRVTVAVGDRTVSDTYTMLYIPNEANLLKNPGFEEGETSWGLNQGAPQIDTEVFRSGGASVRLTNASASDSSVSQGVTVNQKTPAPILIRASSKAHDVSGAPGRGYSLYVDIYYTDGTPSYGNTYDFQTGTTDWQLGELLLEVDKPVRNVNVYLLLRGKKGTVWFDDIAVMEDPTRAGNIAHEAEVAVDSSYSGYTPDPINDGITLTEGLHWTKQAWASTDNDQPHFIDLAFAEPREIDRLIIYWSLDSDIPRTSREIVIQVPDGDGWKTVTTATPNTPRPRTAITLDAPVTTDHLRVYQPAGKGSDLRRGLMWVREIEIFEPR